VARSPVTKKAGRKVGIPGDIFRVEIKGNSFYVINAATKVIMAGPYQDREAAQKRADALQRTAGR